MKRALVVAAVMGACAVGAGPASALTLHASRTDTGWIGVRVHAAPGTPVELAEEVGTKVESLATLDATSATVARRHAVRWRCGRRVRRLLATQGDDTATATVRTPGCAHRLALDAEPVAPHAGTPLTVSATDRWGVGLLRGSLCARAPGSAKARCRAVRLAAGQDHRRWHLTLHRAGGWHLELRTAGGGRFPAVADVRRRGERLRLLATGDSMIQIIDSYLAARLHGRARVRSDAHIGTGISKPFQLDWDAHARSTARRLRPDATVVALGANDGFAFGHTACCGKRWTAAYARRVRAMMRAYTRHGAARVYWITLPAPRKANFARVYRSVDHAIHRAARGLSDRVRLIDTVPVFTPGFRYRSTLCRHGACHVVRQGDGVHFNIRGASIVERMVQRAMRADGLL
jgi:lysophospholipase L1-like esterase